MPSEDAMPETSLSIDARLAREADRLFRELGLDLTSAVRLFLLQSLREQGLPFTPRLTATDARPSGDTAEQAPRPGAGQTEDTGNLEAEAPGEGPAAPCPAPSCGRDEETGEARSMPDGQGACSGNRPEETVLTEEHDADAAVRVEASPVDGLEGQAPGEGPAGDLRTMGVLGRTLRRVRTLNRLYAIGTPNPHVGGWREVYVSGDEPFALDLGTMRLELTCRDGGGLRVMDGRLPDEVLEADAVFPRDLSPVFSSVIGQELTDLTTDRVWNGSEHVESLRFIFANRCSLIFAPGRDWGSLWLCDAQGSTMFAPETVWRRVLDERAWLRLR